jgi:hypothetical protein
MTLRENIMNSNTGGLNSSAMDSTVLPNQKHDISLIQKRMLTPLEIELLQKDKRDSFEKMRVIMKSAEWFNKNTQR